jgi:hypothetical protein
LLVSELLKNYCATLIRACAVLGILMYSLCTLRFLRSGRTRLKAARDVFQQPVRPSIAQLSKDDQENEIQRAFRNIARGGIRYSEFLPVRSRHCQHSEAAWTDGDRPFRGRGYSTADTGAVKLHEAPVPEVEGGESILPVRANPGSTQAYLPIHRHADTAIADRAANYVIQDGRWRLPGAIAVPAADFT